MRRIVLCCIILVVACACSKEHIKKETESTKEYTIYASFENSEITRTILGEDGKTPQFEVNDEIWLSNGTESGSGFVKAVDPETKKATIVSTKVRLDEGKTVYAIYPASAAVGLNDGKLEFNIGTTQSGRFADANICVAKGNKNGGLSFKNVCSIFRLEKRGTVISAARLAKTGIAGKLSASFNEEGLEVLPVAGETHDEVVVNFDSDASNDYTGPYYISAAPGLSYAAKDVIATYSEKDSSFKRYKKASKDLLLRRSVIYNLGVTFKDISADSWPEKGMETKTYINNGEIQIGVDLSRGGSIFHLSDIDRKESTLNHADAGRLVQQSFYGDSDGSYWEDKETSWCYNPVQGGGYKEGYYGEVISSTITENKIVVKSYPMHWATCKILKECTMQETITLSGRLVKIKFNFKYNGTKTHSSKHQEMPAMFVDWKLGKLVYYNGKSPWTDGKLTTKTVATVADLTKLTNKYLQGNEWAEKWAAYIGDDGYGIGIYSPSSTLATYYRYGTGQDTGPSGADCSYIAPLQSFGLKPEMSKTYYVYLYLGTKSEIRAAFKEIATK